MDVSGEFNGSFQQLPAVTDPNALMNTTFNAHGDTNLFPPHQSIYPICNNGNNAHYTPARIPEKTGNSLTGAVAGNPPQYRPPLPLPPLGRAIHKVSPGNILHILQFIAPPRTRDGLYHLSKLSRVCRSWRMALLSQPRAWATIFATRKDRRSFVEMCLERSQPVTLEVTVDASDEGRTHPHCTCDEDTRLRLIPNESDPCEWHFQFESLAEAGHSKRVHKLNIDFDGMDYVPGEWIRLALGSCRFFTLPFPYLTDLRWEEDETEHGNYIFSTPPFPPTLRLISFKGSWDGSVTQVNNLISFTFENYKDKTDIETFRSFISNNRSLESLSLKYANFEGTSRGLPVSLFNLKSFNIDFHAKNLSTIIRIPALQRLSSLWISMDEGDVEFTLRATGDGIMLSTKSYLQNVAEAWQDLTGYVRPTIRHIRLYDDVEDDEPHVGGDGMTVVSLLTDVHTLEIGRHYWTRWYNGFVDDLKHLGPQLKTIRFAISDEHEPFKGRDEEYADWGGDLLDKIEELVKFRFEEGRPLSVVERMVVSRSERTNRQEDYVWRCFYGSRKLSRYVRPA